MEKNKIVHGYHDLTRPEILSRIPLIAQRILDVGCGTGSLGRALKQRQNCAVHGIESNPDAAKEAEKNLDTVYLQDLDMPFPLESTLEYDCIIFADILEHLKNPWGVFLQQADNLKEEGTIIISLPNIAHYSIIRELTLGLFRYQGAGILDITHLRFFTKTTFCEFLCSQNFKIKDITPHPSKENPIQFIFTVKKKKSQEPRELVTLIIPTFNTKRITEKAIDSIFKNTKISFKLIVIDNNSKDGTAEMLRNDDRLLHIENSANLGFPTAVNLGLNCVDTPYFAILNSDIIVTENWLTHMIQTMTGNSKNGIVGPRSNYVSGPQLLQTLQYNTQEQLHNAARDHMQQCTTLPTEFHRIVFFCTLFRSELLQKIGTLDEIFGMGNFEDDDYCRRAINAGYKCLIDHQVFIHHFGSQTFKKANVDFKKLMEKNQAIYKKKWGIE